MAEIKCVFSGRYALDGEYELPPELEEAFPFARDEPLPAARQDEEEDDNPPIGWVRITVERRVLNPVWAEFQQDKAAMIQGQQMSIPTHRPDKSAIPPEDRAVAERIVQRGTDGALYGLEEGIPKFIMLEQEIYVSPPEQMESPPVIAAWESLSALLELTKDEPAEGAEGEDEK